MKLWTLQYISSGLFNLFLFWNLRNSNLLNRLTLRRADNNLLSYQTLFIKVYVLLFRNDQINVFSRITLSSFPDCQLLWTCTLYRTIIIFCCNYNRTNSSEAFLPQRKFDRKINADIQSNSGLSSISHTPDYHILCLRTNGSEIMGKPSPWERTGLERCQSNEE